MCLYQVSGNAKLLGKLMDEVKKSQAADAARASAAAESGKPSSRPGASRTWMSDKDTSHCCGCRSVFSFIRRKHHCRYDCMVIFNAFVAVPSIAARRAASPLAVLTFIAIVLILCAEYYRLCGQIFCNDCSSG